jgi:hypothetical protein
MASGRREYIKGPRRQLSDEWKSRVKSRLNELGHDYRWLESQIGASSGAISRMLTTQSSSALMEPVCRALGIAPPTTEVHNEDEMRLVEGFRKMTPEQRAHLLGLLGLLDRGGN